jgi:glycosyltransferase involved in cell wall biosynthesis
MRDEMIRQRWVRGDNILVAHDAAEPSIFHIQTSQTEARSILGMPRESFVAVYTGRFRPMGMDKGLEAAIRCLSSARAEGVNLVVYAVGGTESEIEIYRNIALAAGVGEYVILVPYSPQEDVARFHIAADVLLMNLPSTDVFFKYYTSPLKLFEYMMAGRAIIASNLPSIQDVVSKEIAFVITPDSDGALSEALITLAKNSALREQLGAAALLESEKYTWDARAQSILDFIT